MCALNAILARNLSLIEENKIILKKEGKELTKKKSVD